jgi:antitoxin ParD1/3/4
MRRGAFASSSEYIRNLVRERYQKERDRTAKLQQLGSAFTRGLADVEAGRVVSIDDAFRRLARNWDLPETDGAE